MSGHDKLLFAGKDPGVTAGYSGRSTADEPGGTIIISRGAGVAGAPPTEAALEPAPTDVPTTWLMHFD